MRMSTAEWLAQAARDPQHFLRWTTLTGSVMLSNGVLWDAVKVPSLLALAAIGPLDETGDDETSVQGPSVHDPAGVVYFLVPVGTSAAWSLAGTECLSVATYLCTPMPGITDGRRPRWLREPEAPHFELVDPDRLRAALVAAGAESVV